MNPTPKRGRPASPQSGRSAVRVSKQTKAEITRLAQETKSTHAAIVASRFPVAPLPPTNE